jgi:hypothetical protein
VLVPGPEPAGPAARHVHPRHDLLALPHAPRQRDRALDEHPPLLGRQALGEQLGAGLGRDHLARLEQLAELVVAELGEQRQRSELVDGEPGAHQTVAR